MTDAQARQEKKRIVLLVEDDKEIRDMYCRKLVHEEFQVFTAEDGVTGIAQAMERRPDLILLDVKMPGMTGFEMLKQLRAKGEWGAHVPVIFLTNIDPATEEANAAIEATGPAFYLMKSKTDPTELVVKIREVLQM